jgi:predicted N-acyltransferase
MSRPELKVVDSLRDIPEQDWDALAPGNPTLRHAFLHALHESGSAAPDNGWQANYLTLWRNARLAGAVPLYLKGHSYGEYVFDWAWAEAYQRAGIEYYPKLLSAVPFTPATGPRLLAHTAEDRTTLARALMAIARDSGLSSLHVLFPPEACRAALQAEGMMVRRGVQFHWRNAGYASFGDFLAALSQAKRKKIRQERRKVADSGVVLKRLVGADIAAEHWDFFHTCYRRTYREHRSTPYLNREFFAMIAAAMPENLLLVLAEHEGRPVAAALDLFSPEALYGRYWGSVAHVPGLHFEACYYQGLEFCIERGIKLFEGGAQGEHKQARGFEPVETYSCHWLAHPAFERAVEDFLRREGLGISSYLDELGERSAFKKSERQVEPPMNADERR